MFLSTHGSQFYKYWKKKIYVFFIGLRLGEILLGGSRENYTTYNEENDKILNQKISLYYKLMPNLVGFPVILMEEYALYLRLNV